LAELRRDPSVDRVALEGLASEHVVELARELTREEPDAPALELLRSLANQTRGNPFFLREILRDLSDAGGLRSAARAHAAGQAPPARVTSTIRETIVGRLARLGADAERVLTAAAVAGREFDAELLAGMLDVEEDQLADVLDAAVEAALIAEVPGIGLRYSFVHSLIHPALYEQLGSARRRLLHRRALEALERLLGPDTRPPPCRWSSRPARSTTCAAPGSTRSSSSRRRRLPAGSSRVSSCTSGPKPSSAASRPIGSGASS
jgi:predicted ATPase